MKISDIVIEVKHRGKTVSSTKISDVIKLSNKVSSLEAGFLRYKGLCKEQRVEIARLNRMLKEKGKSDTVIPGKYLKLAESISEVIGVDPFKMFMLRTANGVEGRNTLFYILVKKGMKPVALAREFFIPHSKVYHAVEMIEHLIENNQLNSDNLKIITDELEAIR